MKAAPLEDDDNPCRPRHYKPAPCGALPKDGPEQELLETGRTRLLLTGVLFALAFSVIGFRLVDLTVLKGGETKLAHAPALAHSEFARADIVDRNGVLLARTLESQALVAYPKLVSHVPLKLRDRIRTRAVRPAGARWLPERLAGVKITTGCSVSQAIAVGDEIALKLTDGSERRVDHVLLGTGYQVDISRYDFLPPELTQGIRQFDGYPRLAAGFRTSVPGLHFIGATAARSFGPLLYLMTYRDLDDDGCLPLHSCVPRSDSCRWQKVV